MLNKTVKLTAAKRADGDDKRTAADLLRQTDESWLLKFGWAVNCKTPWGPAELMHEHRDFGRICTEMCVQVPDARFAQPRFDPACLGQICQVERERPLGAKAHATREGERPHKPNWPQERHSHQCEHQRRY